jgi:hypothetical protein
MRALLLIALVAVALPSPRAEADCMGASFGPAQPTLRGKIASIQWGAPVTVRCANGQARCFEAALATHDALTHVRVVLENADYKDARGAGYKMKRVVLDGTLPRRTGECHTVIATGQIRELEIEAKPSAPWRISRVR